MFDLTVIQNFHNKRLHLQRCVKIQFDPFCVLDACFLRIVELSRQFPSRHMTDPPLP